MNERYLRKHAVCSLCEEPIGHTGLPLFWRVTVERFGLDMRAVQQQDGLAAMLNSPALAQIMGPDREMAKAMMDPVVLTVCELCASKPSAICMDALSAAEKRSDALIDTNPILNAEAVR